MSRGSAIVLAALLGLLVAALLFMAVVWEAEDAALPGYIWTALGLGVFFSLVVGIGLMFLVFYSARKGYDQPPTLKQ